MFEDLGYIGPNRKRPMEPLREPARESDASEAEATNQAIDTITMTKMSSLGKAGLCTIARNRGHY